MRKRSEVRAARLRERQKSDVVVETPNDMRVEQAILAAEIASPEFRRRALRLFPPDAFYAAPHRAVQAALAELERRGLEYDPAVIERLNPDVDVRLLELLTTSRPDVPPNQDYLIGQLSWDWRRRQFAEGPFKSLLDALQNEKETPERLRALARQVGGSFDGEKTAAPFLRDSKEVVREMMARLTKRVEGEAIYPFGIEGLDNWEPGAKNSKGEDVGGTPRIIPGADPGGTTIITAMSGSGKALALGTPIATPSGWTTMGDIKPGVEVFDERGERCRVTFCSRVMRGRPCYEVEFSDGAKIVADAEHLWQTSSFRERYIKRMRSPEGREYNRRWRGSAERRENVSDTLLRHWESRREDVPEASVRTTKQIAESLMYGKHRNHAVRVAGPIVTRSDLDLPLDPYVLGLWLGDGASDGAVFYTRDVELLGAFEAEGFVVDKGKSKDPCRYNVRSGLKTALGQLGVLRNKHVPGRYLRASIGQRLSLLQGLMDTDGHASKSGALEFCTTSPRLAEDFEELMASLGIKGKARESDAVLDGRVVGRRWRFTFSTTLEPFRLGRKLARWRPGSRKTNEHRYVVAVRPVDSVPVRCIQVDSPSRLYLAGREMIPTHNTTFAGHAILGLARQKRRVLVGAWEVRAPMTLELLTTLSLKWSRLRILNGKSNQLRTDDGQYAPLSREELHEFEDRANAISKWVTFVENPFRRGQRRGRDEEAPQTNDEYLDVLEDHVEASGCEVAVFDLFDRVLRHRRPDEEQEALFRMLETATRLQIHQILVHQQLIKGEHVRKDKKPSLEGLKGSSAYVDSGALILAPHMPARWKNVPDNTIEIYGLKQRFGPPFAVEFAWDPDTGQISGGTTIEDGGREEDEASVSSGTAGKFLSGGRKKGKAA